MDGRYCGDGRCGGLHSGPYSLARSTSCDAASCCRLAPGGSLAGWRAGCGGARGGRAAHGTPKRLASQRTRLASPALRLTVNAKRPSLGCGWASGAGPAGQGGGEGLKGAEKVALEALTGGTVDELRSAAAEVAQEPCRPQVEMAWLWDMGSSPVQQQRRAMISACSRSSDALCAQWWQQAVGACWAYACQGGVEHIAGAAVGHAGARGVDLVLQGAWRGVPDYRLNWWPTGRHMPVQLPALLPVQLSPT